MSKELFCSECIREFWVYLCAFIGCLKDTRNISRVAENTDGREEIGTESG